MKKVKILIKSEKEDIEFSGLYNAKNAFGYVEKLRTDKRFVDMLKNRGYTDFRLNIKTLYGNEGGHSTENPKKRMGVQENSNGSAIIGEIQPSESEAFIEIDGINYAITLDIMPYGIVIGTGKECTNFLGGIFTAYIKKFTSKNVILSTKNSARCFKTENEAIKFIQKNYDSLCHLVESHGYEFRAEFASKEFKKDWEKKHQDLSALDKILEEINSKSKEYNWKINIENVQEDDKASSEEIEVEAADRLSCLLHIPYNEAIEKNKNDIIMAYEGKEIDLDDGAKKALNELKSVNDDYQPYYIIKTYTQFGVLYSVLFVSPYKCEWKLGRPNESNILLTFVYNDTFEYNSEFGSVKVDYKNGVLDRVG